MVFSPLHLLLAGKKAWVAVVVGAAVGVATIPVAFFLRKRDMGRDERAENRANAEIEAAESKAARIEAGEKEKIDEEEAAAEEAANDVAVKTSWKDRFMSSRFGQLRK
jgi:hypothetical protein